MFWRERARRRLRPALHREHAATAVQSIAGGAVAVSERVPLPGR